jgi:excisionase family DNA binding protein
MARPTAAHKQAHEAEEDAHRVRGTRTDASGVTAALTVATAGYDPLLTIEEVSQWLGIPRGTLYQWRSRKQGPRAIKVGGALRYRRAEVETYLDQHTDSRTA